MKNYGFLITQNVNNVEPLTLGVFTTEALAVNFLRDYTEDGTIWFVEDVATNEFNIKVQRVQLDPTVNELDNARIG